MEYEVIFDVAISGYKAWWFPFMGVVIIAGGILVFYLRSKQDPNDGKHPLIKGFKFFFFGFGILWTALSFNGTYSEYLLIKQAINNNELKVVEGVVTEFSPHARPNPERFCVKQVCFEYSDGVVTNGFNFTAANGSPIRDGLPVRVSYIEVDDEDNIIAKLEIGENRP